MTSQAVASWTMHEPLIEEINLKVCARLWPWKGAEGSREVSESVPRVKDTSRKQKLQIVKNLRTLWATGVFGGKFFVS